MFGDPNLAELSTAVLQFELESLRVVRNVCLGLSIALTATIALGVLGLLSETEDRQRVTIRA